MTPKVIAFDFNGTLMNDGELMYAVLCFHIGLGPGTPPSYPEFIRTFCPPYLDYVQKYGATVPEELNWSAWDQIRAKNPTYPQAGVQALLEQLLQNKIPNYVITANNRHRVENELITHGLHTFFKDLYADCEYKHPEIRKILKAHTVKPQEMMYVGDMPVDMHAAQATGVIGIGIGSAKGHEKEHCQILRDAGATYVFPSMSAFHDALALGF